LIFFGAIIGSSLIGFITDKFGAYKMIMLTNSLLNTIVISLIIILSYYRNIDELQLLFFSYGVLAGTYSLVFAYVKAKVKAGNFSFTIGAVNTMATLICAIIQSAIGYFYPQKNALSNDGSHQIFLVFLVFLALSSISLIASYFLKEAQLNSKQSQ
jgi:MFS family permease